MLTGKPPLSHIKPEEVRFRTLLTPNTIVDRLPKNVSQDAKELIMATLTGLVLLIAVLNKWLGS